MRINWLWYLLSVVGAFGAYGLLYNGVFLAFPDLYVDMLLHQRAEDDPLFVWGLLGHLIETLVIVFVYFVWVASKDLKIGALYGAVIGVYYAGTQLSTMGGFKAYPSELVFNFLPFHVVIAALVGVLIAKLYRPVKEA